MASQTLIPTQNDLTAIIEAINSISTTETEVVKKVVASISKIGEIIKTNSIENTIKSLNRFNMGIERYQQSITKIIETVTSPYQDKNFADLLGRIEETDKDKNIKVKYTTIEAAQQLPALIQSAFKALDAMANGDYGRRTAKKVKNNMAVLTIVFSTAIKDILQMFQELSDSATLNELLSCLVKQPDITETIIANNINEKEDHSKTETKLTAGKLGLLDAIAQVFNVFSLMSTLNPPRFGKFQKRLTNSMNLLKETLDQLSKFAEENGKVIKKVNTFTTKLLKDNGIQDLFIALKMITNQVISVFTKKNMKAVEKSAKRIQSLTKVFSEIQIQIIENESAIAIANESNAELLRKINSNIRLISNIIISIREIAWKSLTIRLLMRPIIWGLTAMTKIFQRIVKSFKLIDKLAEELENSVGTVDNVVDTIKNTVKSVLKLSLYLIAGIPLYIAANIAVWLFVGAVYGIILAIKLVITLVETLQAQLITGQIAIKRIVKFIGKIVLLMLILAFAAVVCVPLMLPILIFLGMFLAVVGLVTLISWVVTLATPVLTAAIIGFTILSIVFLLMFSVILIIKLLEVITLDPEKIKENVKAVLDTAMLIIDSIFNREDATEEKESEKGFFASIINFVAGSLSPIIQAIMAIAFLALIIVAISIIMLIAIQLRIIQILDLDQNKIIQNVNIVLDTAMLVIESIFDRPDKDSTESDKSWIVTVIEWFGGGLATIINAIMAIAFLATMLVCITLIVILAAELRLLQEIELDPALISANVTTVIDTCQMVVDSVMDRKDRPDDPSSKSWIRKLLEWCGMGGLLQIVDAIMALAWLGMSVALINMVHMLAQQLRTIQDIELDKGKITKKTSIICNTADAVCELVTSRGNPIKGNSDGPMMKLLEWLFPSLAEAIKMMSRMKWVSGIMATVGVVKQVADALMTLLDMPNVAPVKAKVKYVCDTADEIVKMVTTRPGVDTWDDAKSRMTWMERISKTVKDMNRINPAGINKARKALGAHIKLIQQIKSVDIVKLETSARMFEQMARFSESIHGNFKKLAATLAEDLMPVLEELKEIMEKVPEKLDTGFQNTSASIAATTVAPTQTSMTAQVSRENPNMDKTQVEQLVQQRLKEYSKNESNGVVAKMDQLIDLLKGYSGENVRVQTV